MKFARRNFVSSIFALGAALTVATPSLAQTVGKDYTLISPSQPTDDAAKAVVARWIHQDHHRKLVSSALDCDAPLRGEPLKIVRRIEHVVEAR